MSPRKVGASKPVPGVLVPAQKGSEWHAPARLQPGWTGSMPIRKFTKPSAASGEN